MATTHDSDATFQQRLREFVGQEATPVRHAQEPVNRPMIRHFVEAMGDENSIYLDKDQAVATGRAGIVAPPPMLSTWLMVGYKAHQAARSGAIADSPMKRLLDVLDGAGFTGVVATNDEQTYHRELRPGDQLAMTTVIEDISDCKQTGLGFGYFITTLRTYYDQHGEVVAEQRFRILRFRPQEPEEPADEMARRPKPLILRDNEFWFQAAREQRLVIQACSNCGKLRHPPSPTCPHCHSFAWREVTASGRGTVHSYVTSHHPKAPGFSYPLVVLLVDLEEGTRLVADYAGDVSQVRVGMPVEVEWIDRGDDLVLPRWRAVEES